MMDFSAGQHWHLVGIGGVGLSAIARVLLERGCIVSGSDRATNLLTDALARDGATLYTGHDASHISGAHGVIISSAIYDNPEVQAAQDAGIPVYKRRDILEALLAGRQVIAVAGTAGKTTTSALIAHILIEAGVDPGYIVGGVLANTGTNAAWGSGRWFVIEADEYDNMYHGLRPDTAVITNIDYDHPDFFPTETAMIASFEAFASLVRDDALLLCADNAGTRQLHARRPDAHLYGISRDADYPAEAITVDADSMTRFEVPNMGALRSPLPGLHNVQNVLAAALVTHHYCHVPLATVRQAVASFLGTGRRFELLGEADGVLVIDDYAHHPAKIRATLQAARSRYPAHTLWAVWQPHTYSRTQALMDDFALAFDDADQVLVTEIYGAREQPLPGVSGAELVKRIKHKNVTFTSSLTDATNLLLGAVTKPAIIIVMSAGDGSQIGHAYLARKAAR
ncbi:MAG: UDP-N-acetylmuramate--L-alanine ligase [Armatimonadetes bacterium]|nr:UDP-N-acetylmuramate--L-alanine ligase [Anaerolineae bacterium]